MKEIYLLNKGESVEKVKAQLNLTGNYAISKGKVCDYNYVELNQGDEDIMIVKNYLTKFLYKVKDGETIFDIMSRGFCVEGVCDDIKEGDLVLLSKPKSVRYVVKPLESLEDISEKYGVDKKCIIEGNNLQTEKLFVGQILWI